MCYNISMSRFSQPRHRLLKFLIFLAIVGVGLYFLQQKTNFIHTARFIPPLPVFNDCSKVEEEIKKYDWDHDLALAVAKAESSCDANAHGDEDIAYHVGDKKYGYSVGVFQVRILEGRESCDNYDIATNVKCAYDVYHDAGNSFDPWSGYTTGKYKNYTWRTVGDIVNL